MKASAPPQARRRRGPSLVVLALVVCSLLVPVAFVFFFSAGYGSFADERPQEDFDLHLPHWSNRDKDQDVPHLVHEIKELPVPTIPTIPEVSTQTTKQDDSSAVPKQIIVPPKPLPSPNVTTGNTDGAIRLSEENKQACQIEFGSYCLWSFERLEYMKDAIVKRLKDQLFVARSYFPSIAKIQGKEALARELKQCIQDHEKVLSESIVDGDLPSFIAKKMERMEQTIAQAKASPVDCNNVIRKLSQILGLTEDEAHFHRKQSAFLYHLGVYTMPKSFHCLTMRLTVEYFKSTPSDPDGFYLEKFNMPKYRHYVLFSKHVLAASVTINSTVMSSEVTGNMVFHVVTDKLNYFGMKLWFSRHSFKEAAIHVINYEEVITQSFLKNVPSELFLPEEFRVSIHDPEMPPTKSRMEYISVFSHSHFLLPEIFTSLKKVVLLDDDMVVQHDLSFLWDLDMGEKVNGAVRFCGVKLGHLRKYLGDNIYEAKSCAWMSGLNVIDLEKWREYKVTDKYLQLLEQFQGERPTSLQEAALPLSLLTFHNLVYPLDETLTVSELGYNFEVDTDTISNAAALHYNGLRKPWLDLGITAYRKYWWRFLTREEQYMNDCNLHP
ncbi:Hexosyltransferase [Rhynchospora pubera]|uniref:Hexosyltransferase n=1 Tax=Rhynchospora pubera TaxID=906938 RepID=A0AAV8HL89_9POAL|nr:Hexosyltransferase [Rhynchospora pubera]